MFPLYIHMSQQLLTTFLCIYIGTEPHLCIYIFFTLHIHAGFLAVLVKLILKRFIGLKSNNSV